METPKEKTSAYESVMISRLSKLGLIAPPFAATEFEVNEEFSSRLNAFVTTSHPSPCITIIWFLIISFSCREIIRTTNPHLHRKKVPKNHKHRIHGMKKVFQKVLYSIGFRKKGAGRWCICGMRYRPYILFIIQLNDFLLYVEYLGVQSLQNMSSYRWSCRSEPGSIMQ